MKRDTFYPLRTIVGRNIPIESIKVLFQENVGLDVEAIVNQNLQETVDQELYSKFLPDITDKNTTYRPMDGMATLPIPDSNSFPTNIPQSVLLDTMSNLPDLPFGVLDSVTSLFGYTEELIELKSLNLNKKDQTNPFLSNLDKEFSFIIKLEEPALVGGICFQGLPYISSRIEHTEHGMSIGNYGLPREIRLTPLPPVNQKINPQKTGAKSTQFIDSEYTYTRQEIISHSGFNYLTIDPVKTNLFQLTLTDLPFIPREIDVYSKRNDLNNPLIIKGFKGFIIPYLYFFEYKEQTKHVARLSTGLLGVKTENPHTPKFDGLPNKNDILKRAFPEFDYAFHDFSDLKKVRGHIKDKDGNTLPSALVRVKGEANGVISDLNGSYSLSSVKGNATLVFEFAGYKKLEEPVNGRSVINVVLLPKNSKEKYDLTQVEGVYALFTAHSAFLQRRTFKYQHVTLNYPKKILELGRDRVSKRLRECFISDLLQPNESVLFYLQQGEEFDRCIAGLKAIFMMIPEDQNSEKFAEIIAKILDEDSNINGQLSEEERSIAESFLAYMTQLPPEINFCEKIGIRVFEVSPLDGVSPASVDLDSKYANLLVEKEIGSINEILFSQFVKGIPFKQISTSKYFAIELTNCGNKNGHAVLYSAELLRSAHVSIQPKLAKVQSIKTLHYRLIGPNLGDDYSKLGEEGFNFCIDRVSGGTMKETLFSAMSLLDLVHTGGARLHSNARRRALEEERTTVLGGKNDNFHISENKSRGEGWTRNETGDQVEGKPEWTGENRPEAFKQQHSQENRTHTEILSPQEDVPFWKPNAFIANGMYFLYEAGSNFNNAWENLSNNPDDLAQALLGANQILVPTYNDVKLFTGFETIWRGIAGSANRNNLKVEGLHTISSSPFGFNNIAKDAFELIKALNDKDPLAVGENFVDLALPIAGMIANAGTNIYGFAAANSLGLSLSIQPVGLGITMSTSGGGGNLLPSVSYTNSYGSQGNIQQHASKTGYSYNQHLNNTFNESKNVNEVSEGRTHRLIERKEYPNSDTKRIRGAEILWQDKIQDIITGSVPLNITLPAKATKLHYISVDDSLRVRFNSGIETSIEVDFWFEITEETIKDDY